MPARPRLHRLRPLGDDPIGKFVINHSFIIPGLIGVGTACAVGMVLVKLFF
ncbi:MAG: hypothetical protein U1E19_12995 [Rhodoblastus sp.]